ncbi:MAG: hypothetical protein H0X25_02045, partial [Acidobacteriales bacterium]|nr:hypothetical protein [Terriglobales bacterium]
FQETHHKTGNWLSDVFGATKPSRKRLREMLKTYNAMPAACIDRAPATQSAEFGKWRSDVIANDEKNQKEEIPGLISKKQLSPPLRPDLSYLHFSPDGKYLIAQDETVITVLTREPLAILFYIPAENAYPAILSPDGHSVVFYTSSLRVEKWSIEDQKRVSVAEVTTAHACLQTALSPDGQTLGCFNEDGFLLLIDAATSQTILTKKDLLSLQPAAQRLLLGLAEAELGYMIEIIHMAFSPDGKYFLAGFGGNSLLWDTQSHHELSVPGSLRDASRQSFAFLGPDRLACVNPVSPDQYWLVSVPGGSLVAELPLVQGTWFMPSTDPSYAIVGPLKQYNAGALNLQTKKIELVGKMLDIYQGILARELPGGEISLDQIQSKKEIAKIDLPAPQLGGLKAAAISSDLRFVALSGRTRGGVWDLERNVRTMHIRGFRGAYFADDGQLYADVPKSGQTERQIAKLDPMSGAGVGGYLIGKQPATQHGAYLSILKGKDGSSNQVYSNSDLEIRDVRDGNLLWSRHFAHDLPALGYAGDQLLLSWPVSSSAGREVLQLYSDLKNGAEKEDYLYEVADLRTGKASGAALVKTNKYSLLVNGRQPAGNYLVFSALHNQVFVKPLGTREPSARFFGAYPVPYPKTNMLALESDTKTVRLYDMTNSQMRREYHFPDPVTLKVFSPDGKKLVVVTGSQSIYTIDVTDGGN